MTKPPAYLQLFEYSRKFVQSDDIRKFVPNDPGALGYEATFSSILSSGTVPTAWSFDIQETIGQNLGDIAAESDDPVRFRRFRIFITAVGIAITMGPHGYDVASLLPPHDLALTLLDDARELKDKELQELLYLVFGELHQRVAEFKPFLSLLQLMIVLSGFGPTAEISRFVNQIRKEEAQLRAAEAESKGGRAEWTAEGIQLRLDEENHGQVGDPPFLWTCTVYKNGFPRWKSMVAAVFPQTPENDPVTLLCRDLLPDFK